MRPPFLASVHHLAVASCCVLGLLGVAPVLAQPTDARAWMGEVDALREQGRFEQALARLDDRPADDPQALWRRSRTRVDLGEQSADEARRSALYAQALEEARRSVEALPNEQQAHIARAIAAGRVALESSTREKIELSRELKESIDRAIEMAPDARQTAIAYHVRARWHHEVSSLGFLERAVVRVVYGGLPDASFEQAAADFQRAIELEDHVVHHLELAKTYIELGEAQKAKFELERAIVLQDTDPDAPAYREQARALLERLR